MTVKDKTFGFKKSGFRWSDIAKTWEIFEGIAFYVVSIVRKSDAEVM